MVAYQEFMYSIIQIEDQNERESNRLVENVGCLALLCCSVVVAAVVVVVVYIYSIHYTSTNQNGKWNEKKEQNEKMVIDVEMYVFE